MVSGINSNSISSLQLLRAANAFKSTQAKTNNIEEPVEEKTPEEISLKSDFVTEGKLSGLNSQKMTEIKDFAKKMDGNLTDDDIKYGFMYGRSVLVDYTA
jgi:hypothetical protein